MIYDPELRGFGELYSTIPHFSEQYDGYDAFGFVCHRAKHPEDMLSVFLVIRTRSWRVVSEGLLSRYLARSRQENFPADCPLHHWIFTTLNLTLATIQNTYQMDTRGFQHTANFFTAITRGGRNNFTT